MPSRTIVYHTTVRNSLVNPTTGKEISGGTFTVKESQQSVVEDSRKIRPRPLDNTLMQITRTSYNTGRYRNGNWYGDPTFVGGTTVVTNQGDTTGNLGAAINRALTDMGSSGFDLGLAIAELNDTCRTIAKAITILTDVLHAATLGKGMKNLEDRIGRSLSQKEIRRITSTPPSRRASEIWLNYQLELAPLVNDIDGAIKAYHKGLKDRGVKVSGKSGTRARKGRGIPTSPRQNFGGSGATETYGFQPPNWEPENGGRLASRAGASGTISNPTLASLQSMGLINPLSLGWEKVPLSFLLDYVVPIGPALSAMTAGAGISAIRTFYISERRRQMTNTTIGAYVWDEQIITRHFGGSVLSMKQLMPVVNQSVSHVTTAVALLVSNGRNHTGL